MTSSPSKPIYFYAPGIKRYESGEFRQRHPEAFVALSLTGDQCWLQCDHCQGQFLTSMRRLPPGHTLFSFCQALAQRGTRGLLVSGGSDPRGRVPLLPYLEDLGRAKRELGFRVLVHTGLADEELARGLREAGVDGALMDVVGSPRTAAQVCHLPVKVRDYQDTLEQLTRYGVPAMPHIVLGLHYGRFLGERRALRLVASYPVAALVLVVITPLPGTPMEGITSPPLPVICRFFRAARKALPRTPILLGCARPPGPGKAALDRLAVAAGLDGIAYPAAGIAAYARHQGRTPRFRETCCALLPFDDGGGAL